jgi:prepilin-type N-terminal cleavage/methylation domain-containing protein
MTTSLQKSINNKENSVMKKSGLIKLSTAGFTLLEIMLTIAIIGILASLALPAYQDHIRRSKVGATLQYMTGLKGNISEGIISDTLADFAPVFNPMDYVQCITVKQYNSPDCDHTFIEAWPSDRFGANVVVPGQTRMIVMEASRDAEDQISWRCGPHPESAKAIPITLLPAACRDNITTVTGQSCSTTDTRTENVKCRFGTVEPSIPPPDEGTTVAKPLTEKEKRRATNKAKRAVKRAKKEAKKAANNAKNAKKAAKDAEKAAKDAEKAAKKKDKKELNKAIREAKKAMKKAQRAADKATTAAELATNLAKDVGTKDAEKEAKKAVKEANEAQKSAQEAKKYAEEARQAAS